MNKDFNATGKLNLEVKTDNVEFTMNIYRLSRTGKAGKFFPYGEDVGKFDQKIELGSEN